MVREQVATRPSEQERKSHPEREGSSRTVPELTFAGCNGVGFPRGSAFSTTGETVLVPREDICP